MKHSCLLRIQNPSRLFFLGMKRLGLINVKNQTKFLTIEIRDQI